MSRSWSIKPLPLAFCAGGASLLAGCMTVGPDYHRPAVTADAGYQAPNDNKTNIGPVQAHIGQMPA